MLLKCSQIQDQLLQDPAAECHIHQHPQEPFRDGVRRGLQESRLEEHGDPAQDALTQTELLCV